MKKSYIEPTTNIVFVEMQNLMEASQMSVGEKWSDGSGDSRKSGFWDDED